MYSEHVYYDSSLGLVLVSWPCANLVPFNYFWRIRMTFTRFRAVLTLCLGLFLAQVVGAAPTVYNLNVQIGLLCDAGTCPGLTVDNLAPPPGSPVIAELFFSEVEFKDYHFNPASGATGRVAVISPFLIGFMLDPGINDGVAFQSPNRIDREIVTCSSGFGYCLAPFSLSDLAGKAWAVGLTLVGLYDVDYDTGINADVLFTVEATELELTDPGAGGADVPEPGSLALALCGLIGIFGFRRQK